MKDKISKQLLIQEAILKSLIKINEREDEFIALMQKRIRDLDVIKDEQLKKIYKIHLLKEIDSFFQLTAYLIDNLVIRSRAQDINSKKTFLNK